MAAVLRLVSALLGVLVLLLACGGDEGERGSIPPPPVIAVQPAGQYVAPGETAVFSVAASGVAPLGYQWSKNGTAIAGATAERYTTPPAVAADDGARFSVVVSDLFGRHSASAEATLTLHLGLFTPTGPLAAARRWHTATLLTDGRVLVAGGTGDAGYLSSAELVDAAAGAVASVAPMVGARGLHTATLLPGGKVLLAGGTDGHSAVASAELFDPATGQFMATGSMIAARMDHTATLLADGRVLIAGGRALGAGGYLASAELYDPATGRFSAAASLATARAFHTATLLPDGRVVLARGFNIDDGYLANVEIYEPASDRFTATTLALGPGRMRHAATLLRDGRILLTGGIEPTSYLLPTAELFDPATGRFTPAGPMSSPTGPLNTWRYFHTATLLPNGQVLVAGGVGSQGLAIADAELYDPATGLFTPTGSMGTSRAYHTATALPDGRVLFVAGAGSAGYLASEELYR